MPIPRKRGAAVTDLIDRAALKIDTWERLSDAVRDLDKAPAVDAKPVVHGWWLLNKCFGDYECSVCGNGDVTAPHFKTLKMNYCPNCGAKMREREET